MINLKSQINYLTKRRANDDTFTMAIYNFLAAIFLLGIG